MEIHRTFYSQACLRKKWKEPKFEKKPNHYWINKSRVSNVYGRWESGRPLNVNTPSFLEGQAVSEIRGVLKFANT